MTRTSDKEFERLAVLYAMGALSDEEAARFRAARDERGAKGDRLVRGVERSLAGRGAAGAIPAERADVASVTSRPYSEGSRRGWIAALVVLTLALAGALAWALAQRARVAELADERDRARAAADSVRLASTAREAASRSEPRSADLAPLLAAPGLRVVDLAGPGGAAGRLLVTPDGGAILTATGLTSGEAPLRLERATPVGQGPVAELGSAPRGFLFTVFSSAQFLDGATLLRVSGPDAVTVLEGTP